MIVGPFRARVKPGFTRSHALDSDPAYEPNGPGRTAERLPG